MDNKLDKINLKTSFLTGVVEGFYGRPWTYPQRKELFRRMNQMGMNTYLYAPKDDIKHRQSWRDLYTLEEEQQLKFLINESAEAGVLFIFALSPGLDVTFSSATEVDILKKKVDQVLKLGCHAFALLFDDIEARLCPADREVFSSSARAQVMFANELYNYLGCPNVFLFCPTEYSASLAVPNIEKSEYLATVASCLAPDIAVVWTGSLVVSKRIRTRELEELSALIKHPIVLWDNLHANDYDQRRIFIGPYCGRPLALRRKGLLRGVLTNPNCEFEANYVALHTLAQWSRHAGSKSLTKMTNPIDQLDCDNHSNMLINEDGVGELPIENTNVDVKLADVNGANNSTVDVDGDDDDDDADAGGGNGGRVKHSTYIPRQALHVALNDWLNLMLMDQHASHASAKPSPILDAPVPMETDAIDCNIGLTDTAMQVETFPSNDVMSGANVSADSNSSVSMTFEDLELFADLFYLPFSHGPAGMQLLESGHWLREHSYACGPNSSDPEKLQEWNKKLSEFTDMVGTISRLRDRIQRLPLKSIACELAPYVSEVHTVVCIILDYFRWLETGVMAYRSMAHLRRLLTWHSPGYRDMVTSGDQEPWTFRGGLITELHRILPLESAQDLFPAPSRAVPGMGTIPYLNWPDNGTTNSVIPPPPNTTVCLGEPMNTTATTTTSTPAAASSVVIPSLGQSTVVPPPLINHHNNHNHHAIRLTSPRYPVYIVRPYKPEDKPHIYALFRKLFMARVGLGECTLPSHYQDLPGDRYLGPFLEHSPENCLIIEGPPLLAQYPESNAIDNTNNSNSNSESRHCIGFGISAADSVSWSRDRNGPYRDLMRAKYPPIVIPPTGKGDPTVVDVSSSFAGANQPVDSAPTSSSAAASQSDDRAFGGVNLVKSTMTVDELLKFLVNSFHSNHPNLYDMPTPTEPLGSCLSVDSTLLHSSDSTKPESTDLPMNPDSELSIRPPLISDTAPPSPTPDSNPIMGRGAVIAGGGSEVLHSALSAHPATLLVEVDDLGVAGCSAAPTPTMLFNHSLGLGIDPPELVLDTLIRRLFICLFAAIKTIGAHGAHVQLDSLNEQRAELYRRFGFYPVPAVSNEQNIVLARLI